MKYVKIDSPGEWQLAAGVAIRLLEIDCDGKVHRFIDLDDQGTIVHRAPSAADRHGAIDHPFLSTKSDWTDNLVSKDEFDEEWLRADIS